MIRRGSFQIAISWSATSHMADFVLPVLHAMENSSYGCTVAYSCTPFLRQIFHIKRVENLLLNKPSMDNFRRIMIILTTSSLAFCFQCEPMTICIIPYKQDPLQHFYVLLRLRLWLVSPKIEQPIRNIAVDGTASPDTDDDELWWSREGLWSSMNGVG